MRGVVLLVLVAGCGSLGFGEPRVGEAPADSAVDALSIVKADAPPAIDADPAIDAPRGTGSYLIAESTAPYAALAGGAPVPGFTGGSADDENFMLALPFSFTFYGV